MSANTLLQIAVYLTLLLVCVKPLGLFMARILDAESSGWDRFLSRIERPFYRLVGVDPATEMTWQEYARSVLLFSLMGVLVTYGLQRVQALLPGNPESLPAVTSDSAFNTAISFVSNTNWQGYGGEATMSYLTQMVALAVQNFLSAATTMAALVALIRGFTRRSQGTIGNFWVDMTRSTLFILLPMSLVLSIVLASQGVVQTLSPYRDVPLMEAVADAHGNLVSTQRIALGPAASQIAIKQLGTNGGGFFNANSAHPFENPTPLSNLLQMLSILVIPAALCFTFGEMVRDRSQGWSLLTAMLVIFVPLLLLVVYLEQSGNAILRAEHMDALASDIHPGGNMEGKEVRLGVVNSAIWAVATTAASNGSVNSMHDSFTPIGGLVAMWLMQLGEVVFGGVGSGLYGMIVFAIVAVFIAGLMVGRTPEYLGKKIGAFEIKMASLVILLPCAMVLIGTAVAVQSESGKSSILNPGPHGFSEVLYAFSSASNNNGSAFAGLNANTPFYNGLLGLAMWIGRFGVLIPVIAIAGSLAKKKRVPSGPGTLPTNTLLFVFLLVSVVFIVGALSFFPSLALGPIVEQLLISSAS